MAVPPTPKGDPLTLDHRVKLLGFANTFLRRKDAPHTLDKAQRSVAQEGRNTNVGVSDKFLGEASQIVGQQNIEPLLVALQGPSGIEGFRNNPKAIYAARQYLKVAVKLKPHDYHAADIDRGYYLKMTSSSLPDEEINAKHQILMRDDPVLRPGENAELPDSVARLLMNVHFHTPEGPAPDERESLRAQLSEGLRSLYYLPHVQLVMDTLAAVGEREHVNVIFTNEHPGKIKDLPGKRKDYIAEDFGYCNGHHTIYVFCPIRGPDGRMSADAKSTFVHEAQHLILGRLVRQDASPVSPRSEEAWEIDKALKLDRRYREGLDLKGLTPTAKIFYNALVFYLEKNPVYCASGTFDPNNLEDVHNMRCEAIVNLVEHLARGAPCEDLESVAPHLWAFYQKRVASLFAVYLPPAQEVKHHIAAIPEAVKVDATKLIEGRLRALTTVDDTAVREAAAEALIDLERREVRHHVAAISGAVQDPDYRGTTRISEKLSELANRPDLATSQAAQRGLMEQATSLAENYALKYGLFYASAEGNEVHDSVATQLDAAAKWADKTGIVALERPDFLRIWRKAFETTLSKVDQLPWGKVVHAPPFFRSVRYP
jgi:hypothetical protein